MDYAAPQVRAGATFSAASDMYSLGLLLFRLLTGKRPFPVSGGEPTPARKVCPVCPGAHGDAVPRDRARERRARGGRYGPRRDSADADADADERRDRRATRRLRAASDARVRRGGAGASAPRRVPRALRGAGGVAAAVCQGTGGLRERMRAVHVGPEPPIDSGSSGRSAKNPRGSSRCSEPLSAGRGPGGAVGPSSGQARVARPLAAW